MAPPALGVASFSHAGVVSRALALVIDLLLVACASALVNTSIVVVADFFGLRAWPLGREIVAAASIGATLTLVLGYFVISWALNGRTAGKAFLGLRIVRTDGTIPSPFRCFVRLVGYWLSALPMFLGFTWCLFDRRRQCWHDKLAGTYVVRNHLPPRPRPFR